MTVRDMSDTITPSLLNYLEAISAILKNKQVARIRDIAAICEVKIPSVCSAMVRLTKLGYINYETGEFITMNRSGFSLVKKYGQRRDIIEGFLRDIVHMDSEMARDEARMLVFSFTEAAYERIVNCLAVNRKPAHPDDKIGASSEVAELNQR